VPVRTIALLDVEDLVLATLAGRPLVSEACDERRRGLRRRHIAEATSSPLEHSAVHSATIATMSVAATRVRFGVVPRQWPSSW